VKRRSERIEAKRIRLEDEDKKQWMKLEEMKLKAEEEEQKERMKIEDEERKERIRLDELRIYAETVRE